MSHLLQESVLHRLPGAHDDLLQQVEIKPDMVGHYLAEFSISYKPVKHGKPGIGATHSSRFIPLK
jgi:small subunit ribosomal protein S15e